MSQQAAATDPKLADVYWRAGFRHITEEVYKLKQVGKLNSTKEKALLLDLFAKLDGGEYNPPLQYVVEEMQTLVGTERAK